jgi:predicted nuclease of restriction endonuclease-like (RecB) superfamily
MSFEVTIQYNLKKLRWSLNALETKVASQATVRTLNRGRECQSFQSAKHIAPQLNSRQAAVKRRIQTQKASFKRL